MGLSIQNVSKSYGNGIKALNNISIEISAGMFGLLGPNGAGKSSLMRTIATLQFPDSGRLLYHSKDIFTDKIEFRRILGYLPQEFGVYPKESAESLLKYFTILKGISSRKERNIMIDRVLEITNLKEHRHQHVSTFSGGMHQRFGIAQLLLNQPKVIIVDEPTAGLDPAERSRFLNILRSIGNENIVIFSTHLVEDVKDLCNDMAIINEGKLLTQIAPKNASQQLSGKIWETDLKWEKSYSDKLDYIKLIDAYNDNSQITTRIYAENHPTFSCISVQPKLEDYYFLTLQKMAK